MNKAVVFIKLEDFLRTGVFGPIQFGMTREALIQILGEPDCISQRRKDKHPTRLEYGDFEFYFVSSQDNRLCAIYLDNFDDIKGNERLKVDTWFLKGQLSLAATEEQFRRADLRFRQAPHYDPTVDCLKTDSGVELGFCKAPSPWSEPPGGLYYISYDLRNAMTTSEAVKQVSVTIPEAVYEKIRAESLKHRKKIAKMCSEWIVEKASKIAAEN